MHRRLAGRIAGALAAAATVAAATLTAPVVQAAPVQAAPIDAVVPQSAVAIEAAAQAGCATTGYTDLFFTGSVPGNPTGTALARTRWVQCPSGKRIQSLTLSGSSNVLGLMRSNNYGNPSVYYWNNGTLVNGYDASQYIDVTPPITVGLNNVYADRVGFDGWMDLTSGTGPVFNVGRNL
jgi:hypothetical protein